MHALVVFIRKMSGKDHNHCSAVASAELLLNQVGWIGEQLCGQGSYEEETLKLFQAIMENLRDIGRMEKEMVKEMEEYAKALVELGEEGMELLDRYK